MKNNDETYKHFKRFMTEMLNVDDADYRYLCSFLNCEIHDGKGNSYLILILQTKEYHTLCINLTDTIKRMASFQLELEHSNSKEVERYLKHNDLFALKMNDEFVLVADADGDDHSLKPKSVRVRSINEIKERNKYIDMRRNSQYG